MLLCSGIEFEKAMSDWNMYEDKTRKSSDHVVPCGSESVSCADVYGTLQQGVDNDSGKRVLGGTLGSNQNWWEGASLSHSSAVGCSRGTSLKCLGSSRGLCDNVKKQKFQDSEYTKMGTDDNEYAKIGTNDDAYFSSNPVLTTGYATDCNNVEDAALVVNDTCLNGVPDRVFGGPSIKHKYGENELLDSDWPDVGDFEDIDALFRNCDSTSDRGNTGTGDELSWFLSSSSPINTSADADLSGLPSTCSELSGLSSMSGHHRTSSLFLGRNDQTCFDFHDTPNYQTYSSSCNGDAGGRGNYTPEEQGNLFMKPCGSGFSQSVKRKDHPLDHKNSTSTCSGPGFLQHVPAEKLDSHVSTPCQNFHHIWDPSLKGDAAPSHAIKLEGISVGHLPSANASLVRNIESATNSCSSNALNYDTKCMEKLHQFSGSTSVGVEGKRSEPNLRPQTATLTENPSPGEFLASAGSTGKRRSKLQDGINGNTCQRNQNIKHPATDIDSFSVPEGSCISSGYDGPMLMEAVSFQQLQDAMHKLDVTTKLRIRDSLYRLARSAEQRHGVADRIYERARGVEDVETSNGSAGLLDAETETNPIDRSIAQLLFHSPSGGGTNISDDSFMR